MRVPEGWSTSRLGDLFEIQLGKMLNKEASQKQPQYPYLGNREVQWGKFDLSQLRSMYFSDEERKKFQLRDRDLLVCEGGEVGRTALWRGGAEIYYQKALHRLRPNSERIIPEFMLHFMRYSAESGRLVDYTSQSSIAHLTREKLAEVEVLLPPVEEQREVVRSLSSVDDAIEVTQAVIDQLQVVKKAMMGELLTKGIPGRHSRFKKTEIGEVPEGWGVVPLGDAGEWLSGGTPSKQNGAFWTGPIPWVSPKDMKRSRIDDAIDHVSEAALGNGTRLAPVGSILMVVRGMILAHSFPVALTIAPVAFNQDVKALVPSREFEADYLLYCLQCRAQEVVAMADVSNHGTKRLATEKLFALAIPRPERDEQKEIAATIRSVEVREERERAYVEQLRTLKSALLSVLLTGEVRVRGGAPIPGPSPVAGEGRAEG